LTPEFAGTAVAVVASMARSLILAVTLVACLAARAFGQAPPVVTDPGVSAPVPSDQEVTLTFENRPIVVLRARLLTRMPHDRAASAVKVLDDLVERRITEPVETREVAGAIVLTVGGKAVVALLPADADVLTGETVQTIAADAADRLRQVLVEATELRQPGQLLRGLLASAAVTALLLGLLWALRWIDRLARHQLTLAAERRMRETSWHGQALRLTHLSSVVPYIVRALTASTAVLLVYSWLTFVLRRFPYTRPWGESLRTLLFDEVVLAGSAFMNAVPGLFAVAVILIVARGITKGVTLVFHAAEQGRITIPGVYRDTAVATRRLINAMLWLLALALAYPHVPGGESEAFKGLSLFVGVVVSLGSSGVMQHLMSGLMLTFSRAVHVGDFARMGDIEGTVLQIGALATKIRTPVGEEITIPNAVVVSQTTTNYSSAAGVAVPRLTTSVTIGYDTPWRQVEALLLNAAHRTQGVRAEPAPFVWRMALEDFYVKYTLLVSPDDPRERFVILDRLHAHILDSFNEHDVQIMSPHYLGDPSDKKVVPLAHWHEAPAVAPASSSSTVPLPAVAAAGIGEAAHNIR
jgi:small-conductance mechanosensitive channel